MSSLAPSVSRQIATASDVVARTWGELEPTRELLAAKATVVTPLGWGLACAGFVAWLLGEQLGWLEFEYAAAACLVMLVTSVFFLLGRSDLSVDVRIAPPRVVVGDPAAGEVIVRNRSEKRLIPVPVELPVGAGLARFDLPPLPGRGEYEDAFVVPTSRRAVIPIGPPKSVRSDPFGLFRREVSLGKQSELFVHPRTAFLDPMGTGLLRDLEGNETDAISQSDLAFHSLRGYVAGDDRRHVHWRTTARMPSGDLMVRQFLDTRRSHLVVIVDSDTASYGSEDEFELAISAAASFALRGVRDEQDVTVIPGQKTVARGRGTRLLDAFSRIQSSQSPTSLERLTAFAAASCSDASLAVLATGSRVPPVRLESVASTFNLEVAALGLMACPGASSSLDSVGRTRVLRLAELADLPRLAQAAVHA